MKMTKLPNLIAVALMTLFILAAAPVAWATNYLWDGAATQTPATGSDGNGTWDTSSTKWGNTTDVAWPSSPATTDAAYIGQSANTAAYTITVNQASSGITINNISFRDMANYGSYTITGTGASGTINMNSADFFTIQTGAGGTNTVSAPIVGTLTSGKAFVVSRPVNTSGKLILSGANTFTPGTALGVALRQGTVFVSSLNTVGSVTNNNSGNTANQASSCLGAAVSGKSGISIGYNGYAATLIYTGSGEGTDRPFTICAGTTPATGAAGTIQNDGTGPLVLAGAITTTATAGTLSTRPFTLQGANTGLNEVKGIISDASASLLLSLTKAGAGNWTLSGANTYSGGTTISGGTLKIIGDGNLGTAPSSPTAGNLVINNATLEITSPMTLNANRGIALGATSGTVSGFLQLDSGANVTYAGIMANNGAGTGNLYLNGTAGATLTLSGSSTFTGNVVNRQTILSVASINTAGTVVNSALPGGQSTHQPSSNLGAPTSASIGSIQLGYNGFTGTLLYTGSGEGSDRNIIIGNTSNGGTGGGAIIQNDGTGPLVFTGTFTAGGASATASHNKTLTLQGSNTGASQITTALPDGVANGSYTAITSLTKAGAGTWQLTAANTYSGNTTVSSGILALSGNGSVASSPLIGIAGGATFDVSGLSSTFTLGNSQTLTNRSAGAILLGNLNTGSGTTSLVFDGTNPSFIVTNGTMTLSASTTFKVNKSGGALAVGVYKLIGKATAGNVGAVAGTVPSVTVNNGASQASMCIVDGELYLTNGAASTVTLTGSSFTYNGSAQTPSISFSGSTGAKTTNYLGISVSYNSVNPPTNAGNYYVSNTVAADANYFGATNGLAFTIGAKAASVTANPQTKTYGDVNPTLTATVAGTVNGDVLNYTLATDATQFSSVGVSNITVTLGSNPNYSMSATNSTLTINQASTFVGASSTKNPSGYTDSVAYIATLPADATGSVVFSSTNGSFSTNALTGGSTTSLSITNLPRGTNVITVAYLGDGNYLGSSTNLEQIVTNHLPVLLPLNLTRTAGLGLHFTWSELTNQWSDVDGDAVTLTSFNLTTSNSITLSTNDTLVGYPSSAPNVADQISYTASDSYGATVNGVINIAVNAYVTGTNSIVNITTGNPTTLKAYGVIGFSYITERSTNLTDWASIATNTVSTNGVISVSDSFSDLGGQQPGSAFYRIKWQP